MCGIFYFLSLPSSPLLFPSLPPSLPSSLPSSLSFPPLLQVEVKKAEPRGPASQQPRGMGGMNQMGGPPGYQQPYQTQAGENHLLQLFSIFLVICCVMFSNLLCMGSLSSVSLRPEHFSCLYSPPIMHEGCGHGCPRVPPVPRPLLGGSWPANSIADSSSQTSGTPTHVCTNLPSNTTTYGQCSILMPPSLPSPLSSPSPSPPSPSPTRLQGWSNKRSSIWTAVQLWGWH